MISWNKFDLILEEVLRERKHVFLISAAKVRKKSESAKLLPPFFFHFPFLSKKY